MREDDIGETRWDDHPGSADLPPDRARNLAGDPVENPGRSLVTIDGPAGSGKSTTARAVAERLGWRYLDSGALYRALTFALLDRRVEPERWRDLSAADLSRLGVELVIRPERIVVLLRGRELGEELRSDRVTAYVSQLSALPAVREWLLGLQHEAGRGGRLVADGRDMGTIVFPHAWTKIFLHADVEERARRRLAERGVERPGPRKLAAETAQLEARDRQDSTRALSPLAVPEDALVLDTTGLSFDDQVDRVVDAVIRGIEENTAER